MIIHAQWIQILQRPIHASRDSKLHMHSRKSYNASHTFERRSSAIRHVPTTAKDAPKLRVATCQDHRSPTELQCWPTSPKNIDPPLSSRPSQGASRISLNVSNITQGLQLFTRLSFDNHVQTSDTQTSQNANCKSKRPALALAWRPSPGARRLAPAWRP